MSGRAWAYTQSHYSIRFSHTHNKVEHVEDGSGQISRNLAPLDSCANMPHTCDNDQSLTDWHFIMEPVHEKTSISNSA